MLMLTLGTVLAAFAATRPSETQVSAEPSGSKRTQDSVSAGCPPVKTLPSFYFVLRADTALPEVFVVPATRPSRNPFTSPGGTGSEATPPQLKYLEQIEYGVRPDDIGTEFAIASDIRPPGSSTQPEAPAASPTNGRACTNPATLADRQVPSPALLIVSSAAAATQFSDLPASQPASRELLELLQQQLKSVDTVQADFVQQKKLSVFNHTVTLTGHLALQKPNKLVWIVNDPVKYAVRIDGDEIRQWDQDTNQVQVIHLGGDPTFAAVTQQLQAWFMGDYKALGDSYDVTLLGEHPLRLSFVPKGQSMVAKALKQVDLTFGKSEQYIDQMVVTEASGDVTTLQFNHSQVNQPIPKETWEIPPHER